MTLALAHIGSRRGARIFVAGWIGVVLFAALALAVDGWKDLAFAVVLTIVAVAMMGWYATTTGRAPAIIAIPLGAFFMLQQAAFVAQDLGWSGTTTAQDAPVDALGLVAAVLIVAGSVAGLVRPKQTAS